jgi:hypothetical protein
MADTADIRAELILHTVVATADLAAPRAMADRGAEFPATADRVAHRATVGAALLAVAADTIQRPVADTTPEADILPAAGAGTPAVAAAIPAAEDMAEVIVKVICKKLGDVSL